MSKTTQLNYLTELSDKGVVNIEAAAPYLKYQFPELTDAQAKALINEWVNSKFLLESKGCKN